MDIFRICSIGVKWKFNNNSKVLNCNLPSAESWHYKSNIYIKCRRNTSLYNCRMRKSFLKSHTQDAKQYQDQQQLQPRLRLIKNSHRLQIRLGLRIRMRVRLVLLPFGCHSLVSPFIHLFIRLADTLQSAFHSLALTATLSCWRRCCCCLWLLPGLANV